MNRIMALLAILLLPLPAYAMKRIADSDLSSISGPASLSISFGWTLDIDSGPLAWGNSYYISRVISFSANSSVSDQDDEDSNVAETDETGRRSSSASLEYSENSKGFQNLPTPRLALRGGKVTYSDVDIYYPYETVSLPQLETRYTDEYLHGRSSTETNPKIIDLRPDGYTQLRIYYTGTINYTVLPKSTLDVWVH